MVCHDFGSPLRRGISLKLGGEPLERLRQISLHKYSGVLYYTGRIITWVAVLMFIPLLVSALYQEWDIFFDFLLSITFGLTGGFAFQLFPKPQRSISWLEGMVIASLSWVVMVLLSALPFWLSGFYLTYLDACFDAMSGYTTTGLTLVVNLDHMSYGVNMWRQLICFVGGQGIVVLVMSFFLKNAPGSFKIYVGEAKSDKILPNIVHTARAIWFISILFLLIGTAVLALINLWEGLRPDRAFLHGLWIFLAGWSGAGFTPQSQSLLYYHSGAFELGSMLFMLLGSVNFALHYAVLTRNRGELWRNLESRTYVLSILGLLTLVYLGLYRTGLYQGAWNLFRKGFFQLISAHTGTGYQTVVASDFLNQWGSLPVFALIIAMLFGGMSGSTAGGLKMLRVGISTKGIIHDVKRLFYPESAVILTKFRFYNDVVLTDNMVRSALTIIVLYILTFSLGTGVGALYGYPLTVAAFESASATGNVGLTMGLTSPSMPVLIKVTYIFIMYVARLEFLAVFALMALLLTGIRWRRRSLVR